MGQFPRADWSVRSLLSRSSVPFRGALVIFAFQLPAHAQEVLQSTDKFSGSIHYQTRLREAVVEGCSFLCSQTVRFNLNSYRPGTTQVPYTLGLQTLTHGWIFVRAGNGLDLKINGGGLMHLVGDGSSSFRQVLTGDLVREDAFYDLSPDQLSTIAHAKTVDFRIYGDEQIVTGSIPAAFFKDAAAFVSQIPASPGTPVAPTAPRQLTLGIHFVQMTPQALSALHMTEDHGLLIYQVDPGSRAEKSGIQKADVLLSLNNVPTRSEADLPKAMTAAVAGRSTLHIWRGGSLIDLTVDQLSPPE
jgi:PDZ domain